MQSCSILVVDDDAAVRMVASEMLGTLGCVVVSVNSGRDALEELDQNAYELIFLDVGMPIMSGVEVCRRIREHLPQQKIVFITGYSKDDLTEVLDDRTWVVSKPFSIDSLQAAVERGRA